MTKGRLRRWRVRAIFERALPSAIAYELKRAVNAPAGGSKGRAGVVVTDSWVMNNELGDGMLERFLDLVWRPAERRRRNAASLGARRRIEEHPGFAGVLRALGGMGGHVGAPHVSRADLGAECSCR